MSRRRGEPRVPDRERPVGREAQRSRSTPPSERQSGPAEAGGPLPGRGLVVASWVGTATLAVAVAAGLAALDTVAPAVVAISVLLFVCGSVAFFVAYARAVGRSRHELIGIGGLYFMADSAPPRVRRSMMASLATEVVLVIVAVAARPFSSLVFTSLAPVYALGLAGWWSARYGSFVRKPDGGQGRRAGGV